jgi:hypothetical protein
MTIAEILLAALRNRFGAGSFREGTPPEPLAVFPAKHPEVGDLSITTAGIHASLTIGEVLSDHFNNFDTHLDDTIRAERVTRDVVRFLDHLFADRLLFWMSDDGRRRGGWRERGEAGHVEPLARDNVTYRVYLWSGPLSVWRATTSMLARGYLRNERDYEVLLTCLGDAGPNALKDSERDRANDLIAEYERNRPGANPT